MRKEKVETPDVLALKNDSRLTNSVTFYDAET